MRNKPQTYDAGLRYSLLLAPDVHVIEPPNPKVGVVVKVVNRGRQFHPIQPPLAPGELEVLPQVLEDELGGAFH